MHQRHRYPLRRAVMSRSTRSNELANRPSFLRSRHVSVGLIAGPVGFAVAGFLVGSFTLHKRLAPPVNRVWRQFVAATEDVLSASSPRSVSTAESPTSRQSSSRPPP